jgi:hypothetical protein
MVKLSSEISGGKMMARHHDRAHLTCGSLRGLQAFRAAWLRAFPAPKQSPRLVVELVVEPVETLSKHTRRHPVKIARDETQAVGTPMQNKVHFFK